MQDLRCSIPDLDIPSCNPTGIKREKTYSRLGPRYEVCPPHFVIDSFCGVQDVGLTSSRIAAGQVSTQIGSIDLLVLEKVCTRRNCSEISRQSGGNMEAICGGNSDSVHPSEARICMQIWRTAPPPLADDYMPLLKLVTLPLLLSTRSLTSSSTIGPLYSLRPRTKYQMMLKMITPPVTTIE